ncbi:MAG: Dabb family protein [Oscillospiraceae bacterium]|nr:Dabb family protein [Oscillospiraceae bacterium]
MLRHIVMYKFLPEAQGRTKEENLQIAAELAEAMEREIGVLKGFQCGIGSKEAKETNYDVVLVCDMKDFEALGEYKAAQAHKNFGTHCHAVSSDRAAIDYFI